MNKNIKSLVTIATLSIGLNSMNALAKQPQDNFNKSGIEYNLPLSPKSLMENIKKFHESLEGSWKDKFLPDEYTKNVKLKVKEQISKRNPKAINIINAYLEHVPDKFQKLLNNNGYTFFIYDRKFTDFPELASLKGKKVPLINQTWDEMKGITTPDKVYINQDLIQPRGSKNIPLHEAGHTIDRTLGKLWNLPDGKLSNSKEYGKIFEKCKTSIGKGKRQKKLKKELFAEGFAMHYDGFNSRYAQKEVCPEHYNFFNKLEQKIVFGK